MFSREQSYLELEEIKKIHDQKLILLRSLQRKVNTLKNDIKEVIGECSAWKKEADLIVQDFESKIKENIRCEDLKSLTYIPDDFSLKNLAAHYGGTMKMVFYRNNLETFADIKSFRPVDFLKSWGCGRKTMINIYEALYEVNESYREASS